MTLKTFVTVALMSAAPFLYADDRSPVVDAGSWAPVGERIRTPWAEQVSAGNAHPEYPRPNMVRARWQNLNGLWDYSISPLEQKRMGTAEGKILVPFAPESSLSGVGRHLAADSALWYRRSFSVPREWRRDRVLLHFGAVDWKCDVYVNGSLAGRHQGGYTAFSFDITSFLRKGVVEQEISVRVIDGTDNNLQPRGKQVTKPDGIWYTAVSGIWQTVWLEPVTRSYIADYKISSDIDASALTVVPALAGEFCDTDTVAVEILQGGVGYSAEAPSGTVISKAAAPAGSSLTLTVPDAHLWSPDDPYIYGMRIRLVRKGRCLDCVDSYATMRRISVVEDTLGWKRMALNGQILFQYGPLDQGIWPDGIYTAPTDEALRYDIQKARSLGFNMIRKHIKVEPATWYRWCDVLGVLVWQDMPSICDNRGNKWASSGYDKGTDSPLSDQARQNYYKEWTEIVDQLDKYQCIVVWVPFNEAWGQFDTRVVADYTRSLDSTRLVNAASGGNFVAGAGDIIDSHNYPQPWPGFWDKSMVNVLGEYGGIGYALDDHLWQPDKNWGYVKYKSVDEVTDVYLEYSEDLYWQLNEKGTCAAVYTQITDVEGEVNGLLTYDRRLLKVRADDVRAANLRIINVLKQPARDVLP